VLRAHGATDKGLVRQTNEDRFAIDERLGLCVVADGMGGHNAGEVAARLAVDAVLQCVRDAVLPSVPAGETAGGPFGLDPALAKAGNLLRTAIQLANIQIHDAAGTSEEYSGMGTTIVAALVEGPTLSVAHVGDSRLYLLARDRLLRQLTPDDSWLASVLAQDPCVDPAMLQYHPMRHALTNAVGARASAEVHVVEETLSGGELIAMTTDGVHGVLDDDQILRMLAGGEDPAAMAANLVRAALGRGSRDNCTAIVGQYVPD
jgi:serine/threonine protein phosphatase PrpC